MAYGCLTPMDVALRVSVILLERKEARMKEFSRTLNYFVSLYRMLGRL